MSVFPIPRLLGWVTVLVLVVAALGLYQGSFSILKLTVFVVSLIFVLVTYTGHKYFWIGFFGIVAALFNPIAPVHLDAQTWRVIDGVAALGLAFFLWNYYNSYGKGYQFEDYVASLFPAYEWVIADKTRDYSKKFRRIVESDSNPDFTFRHTRTGKTFAVECKYRSYFYQGGVELTPKQLMNYSTFGTKHNMPVFLVLGVGGSPKKPEKLFSIPIKDVNNGYKPGFFSIKDLQNFQRNPAGPFTLGPGGELV